MGLSKSSGWAVGPLNLHNWVDFLQKNDNYPLRNNRPSCFLRSSVDLCVTSNDWEPQRWARGAQRPPAAPTQSLVPVL